MNDPLLRMLANLPELEPDRARSARVRTRCQAALARSGPPRARHESAGSRVRDALLAALGAVYLLETARQALHFLG